MTALAGQTGRYNLARDEINDAFDLRGKLGAFSISDIFQMFSYLQKTSTLTLIQGWHSRTITFEQGTISKEDLGRCLDQLLEISIYTLYLWRNCYFTFDASNVVKEGGVAVESVDNIHPII